MYKFGTLERVVGENVVVEDKTDDEIDKEAFNEAVAKTVDQGFKYLEESIKRGDMLGSEV